jgi:hypothetical protein
MRIAEGHLLAECGGDCVDHRLDRLGPAPPTEEAIARTTARLLAGLKEKRMATRCKFQCSGVTKRKTSTFNSETQKYEPGFGYDAEFFAVTGDSEENKKFFASTPSGSLKVSTYRDDVFEAGKSYYLDISEAP